MPTAQHRYPVSELDPFSTEFLSNPHPFHEQLREAGPAVWLEHYGIWAIARHEQMHAVLGDWETFCSSAGVGLSDFRKEKPWRPPSILLEADPPLHTRTRGVVMRVVSRPAIDALRETFTRQAEILLDQLVALGSFDAVKQLSEVYPLKVFPDAVGLGPEGRENLLPYGSMVFNAFGPRNKLFEDAMANAGPIRDWIISRCRREALAPGGFGAQIYAAIDAGKISEDEAALMVRSFLSAGLDTTVHALGNAIHCFARNPDQWRLLREVRSQARAAFEEVIRYEGPVQTFFRTTTKEVDVAGVAPRRRGKSPAVPGSGEPRPQEMERSRALRYSARDSGPRWVRPWHSWLCGTNRGSARRRDRAQCTRPQGRLHRAGRRAAPPAQPYAEGLGEPARHRAKRGSVTVAVSVAHVKREKSTAFSVMNSRRTGVPSRVFSIPRLIAGTIAPGSVTRSP